MSEKLFILEQQEMDSNVLQFSTIEHCTIRNKIYSNDAWRPMDVKLNLCVIVECCTDLQCL